MFSLAEGMVAGGLRRDYPNIARLFPAIGSTCFASGRKSGRRQDEYQRGE